MKNLGKTVLVFQAVVTLIIGIFFISSSVIISFNLISKATDSLLTNPVAFDIFYSEVIQRFKITGLIATIASLIEILLLSRI